MLQKVLKAGCLWKGVYPFQLDPDGTSVAATDMETSGGSDGAAYMIAGDVATKAAGDGMEDLRGYLNEPDLAA